jgi:phage terminase small subunit
MQKFNIPIDIEQEAQDFMKEVIDLLDKNGVSETVDTGALTMLARNYSMFVKASKEL